MNIIDAIEVLKKQVANPSVGLPDDLFYYISSVTPLVNVDLLIKDDKGRTLLSWRDDQYSGRGWHLPGGIVRFKETLETRLKKVAETELKTSIDYDLNPIAINEIIDHKKNIRAHFISILYRCSLSSTFVPENKGKKSTDKGYLKWHNICPDNLLKFHEIYRELI
ncbi:MAG TPA: NUDIX hydrolase [Elusimicrobia bacterium]|jgi:colanic acid biosynthesis protein WcaH|nr:NUDIX hydrolase [Elusimicrobiota bacterium]